MGVTLPNFASVGFNDPQAVGGQPSFPQESPFAAGEAVLGAGIAKAGQGIETTAAYGQIAKNKMDRAMADANWFASSATIDGDLKAEGDINKLPEIQARYRQAAQTAANAIGDPDARQMWLAEQERHVVAGETGARLKALGLWREGYQANLLSQADAVVHAGVNDDDPRAFQYGIDRITALAESGAQAGSLTPVQAHTFLKQGQQNLIVGRVGALVNKGRAGEAMSLIDQHADDLEAVAPGTVERLKAHVIAKNDHVQAEGAVNWLLGKGPKPSGYLPGMSAGGAISGGAKEHYNLMRSIGASPNEAALLTAAADVESGFNPDAVHDAGTLAAKGLPPGFGMYGHNAERLAAMQEKYGPHPNFEQQARFALEELRRRPEGARVNEAKTPEELTALQEQFEQPKRTPEGTAKRLNATRKYMGMAQQEPVTAAEAKPEGAGVKPTPTSIPAPANLQPQFAGMVRDGMLPPGVRVNSKGIPYSTELLTMTPQEKTNEAASYASAGGKSNAGGTPLAPGTQATMLPEGSSQAAPAAGVDAGSSAPTGEATSGGALRNRTGMPSLQEQYDRLHSTSLSPAAINLAWSQYKERYNAMEADAARSERIAAQQQKQQVLDFENDFWGKLGKPDSGLTAEQIRTTPMLNSDPAKRQHLIELLHNPPGSDIPAPQSAKAAMSLIERIRLPYGDPNKITDSNEIYDHKREMNWPEFDRVMKTFNDVSTPGGETLKELRTKLLKAVEGYITTSNPMMDHKDPAGDQRLYEYDRYVDEMVADAREHKKNPLNLFNPTSPDYLGLAEVVKPYSLSMQESQKAMNDWATGRRLPLPPVNQAAMRAAAAAAAAKAAEERNTTRLPEGGFYAPIPPAEPSPYGSGQMRRPGESAGDYMRRRGL